MTVLTIHVKNNILTAVETYCGDDIKYVESFDTWAELLAKLSKYFNSYAWIEIRGE